MAVALDTKRFGRRLKALYSSWQAGFILITAPFHGFVVKSIFNRFQVVLQEEGDSWSGVTSIIVPAGAASEAIRYSKTSSLYLWLLGYEFTGKMFR